MIDFDELTILIFIILYIPIFLYLKKKKNKDNKFMIIFTLFYIYLIALTKYTQFPIFWDEAYSDANNYRPAYNLLPLLHLSKGQFRTSFLNILLFLPFGFLYFMLSKFSYTKTLFAGFFTSLFVEFLQLSLSILTRCSFRVFDVNDLIFNTIGTFIGIIAYILFDYVLKMLVKRY